MSGNSLVSFPLSGCKLIRWSFLGKSSLQCSCSFLEFPFWNLRGLLACLFLQGNFLGPRWNFWSGVSWLAILSFSLCGGKICLGGLTWLEIAGIFLPQQDLPGWSFVSGNSLVSFPLSGCKLIRWSFLGKSSLQCSCSFLEFPFWNLRGLPACLFLQGNFLGGVSWVGYPGWQFLAFLCLGEKLPRWTYLARKCWNFSSTARLSWVEFCEWKFLSFPLSGCKLIRWSFLGGSSLQCSCSFLEFLFGI